MSCETTGQQKRKEIISQIRKALPELCPKYPRDLAYEIAYRFNLNVATAQNSYIPMFVSVGLLRETSKGELEYVKPSTEEVKP